MNLDSAGSFLWSPCLGHLHQVALSLSHGQRRGGIITLPETLCANSSPFSVLVEIGWRAEFLPADHSLSEFEFDVIIGADGRRNTLEGEDSSFWHHGWGDKWEGVYPEGGWRRGDEVTGAKAGGGLDRRADHPVMPEVSV